MNTSDTRRNRRSLAILAATLMAIAGISWAAIKSDGRHGTEATTNDGGAWLLKQDRGMIGHLNREVREVTAGIRVAESAASLDVDQAPGMIVVHDKSTRRMILVDPRTHQKASEMLLPDRALVTAMPDAVVIHQSNPLQVWHLTRDQALAAADLSTLEPSIASDSSALVVVNNHTVMAVTQPEDQQETTPQIYQLDGTAENLKEPLVGDLNQLTTVGSVLIAADQEGLIAAEGSRNTRISLNHAPFVLQQPSDQALAPKDSSGTSDQVIAIDATGNLLQIDTTSGESQTLAVLDGTLPLAPIVHKGCVFTVTTNPPSYSKYCDGEAVESTPLEGVGSELRLRLVNNWVWINDIQNGVTFMTSADSPLSRIDDWGAALADNNQNAGDATNERDNGSQEVRIDATNQADELARADEKDEDDENEPPVARDDAAQTRVDKPTVVHVLANDEDADGDVLLVDQVELLDQTGSQVWLAAGHTAVQVTPPAGFSGAISFAYTVTDGRGGSATAKATVTVQPANQETNRPPVPVTDIATVRSGTPVSLNVLNNDSDPDGDPLVLLDASTEETGTVLFDPSGQVTFTPDSTNSNARPVVAYTVADSYGATATGQALINVRLPNSNSPPDARNDSTTASVGSPAQINVLENDHDPDGDPLIVARRPAMVVGAEQDAPAQITDDGEFIFTPASSGTFVFEYLVSDGQDTDLAQIRVESTDPGTNLPPVAIRDEVTVPYGQSRLVRVLDNDADPNGDVVGIVDWKGAPGLAIEEVPGVGFRVTAEADAPEQTLFRYAISDGIAEPVATVVVVTMVESVGANQPPIAKPDVAEARAGRTTTIPVLLNDRDPEGQLLRISRVEILQQPQQSSDQRQGATGETAPELDVSVSPTSDGQSVKVTFGADVTGGIRFSYDVQDPLRASASAVVDVRVIVPGQPNRPPVAHVDTGRTRRDRPLEIAVLANDSDPDGDPLTVESIASQPAHGHAELGINGTITFIPAASFTGTDRFQYVVVDTEGGRAIGLVQVGVTPEAVSNRPPTANDDEFATVAGGDPLSLDVLYNDTDPDGDDLVIVSATQPQSGGIAWNENGVTFTPPTEAPANNVSEATELTFQYSVADGHGNTDSALVQVRVAPSVEPLAPVALDDTVGPVKANGQITVDVLANDTDPDGDASGLTVTSSDSRATVINNELRVEVDSESSQHRYTVTDSDGLSSTALVTIVVADNVAPTVVATATETPHETPIELLLGEAVTDADGDPLFFTCCDETRGGSTTVTLADEGRLNVTFSPDPGFTGTAGFSYTVDDQAGHLVSGSVSIVVLPAANQAPTATDGEVSVVAGSSVPFDLSGLVTDPDPGDKTNILLLDELEGLAVETNGTVLTITAPIDAGGKQTSARFQATDRSDAQAEGTLTVTIETVAAEPPIAVPDQADTHQGEPVDIDLLGNDIDPLGRGLQVISFATPDSGTVSSPKDGTVTFAPNADFFGTTAFTYTVRDAADSSARESVGRVALTVVGRPDVPASPQAAASNAEATATWSTPADNGSPIDAYQMQFRQDRQAVSDGENLTELPAVTSHTTRGLVNGSEYQFRVQARNAAGWSEWSGWSASVQPNVKPGQPGPPRVSFADQELVVDWQPPTNEGSPITGYKLEVGGGDNQVTSVSNSTTYTWSELTNGVEYQFRVTATNAAGDSEWSQWSTSEHPLGPPLTPAAPIAQRGNRYLDVSWAQPDDNGDPLSGYEVELRATGDIVSLPGAGTTSYRWADLTNGVTQEFRVRASNRASQPGQWSSWSEAVKPCSPPGKPATAAASRGDETATVTWKQPEDGGCAVLRHEIRANGATVRTEPANSTTHTFTNLTNGTAYSFEIRSVNEQGNGPWSEASGEVVPAGRPTAPTITKTELARSATVILTYSGETPNGSPIDAYEVSINNESPIFAGKGERAIGALAPNTLYWFRVRACNKIGCGPWSATATATTWGPPSAPLGVSSTAGNTTWTMTWSTPATNGGSAISSYQYRLNGGGATVLSPETRRVHLTNRPNGQPITGEVRACSTEDCGPWASAKATPTANLSFWR